MRELLSTREGRTLVWILGAFLVAGIVCAVLGEVPR